MHIIILIALVIGLSGVVAVLEIDDPLNPEVIEWVESIDYETEDESYLFLLGMNIADQDPIEAGRERIKLLREWEAALAKNGIGKSWGTFEKDAPNELITDFAGKYLERTLGGYQALFLNARSESELPEEEKIYLSRYKAWLAMLPPKSMAWPNSISPESFVWGYNTSLGNSLLIETLVHEFVHENSNHAGEELTTYILKLIDLTKNANDDFERQVYLNALSSGTEVLGMMVQRQPLKLEGLDVSSTDLTDISSVLKREQAYFTAYYNLKGARYPSPFATGVSWSRMSECHDVGGGAGLSPTSNLFALVLYKPNMVSNELHKLLKSAHKLSLLSPKQFVMSYNDKTPKSDFPSLGQRLRNWGFSQCFLVNEEWQAWRDYVSRGFDLYAKIQLLNALIDGKSHEEIIEKSINPFTEKVGANWHEDRQQLCFDRPIKPRLGDKNKNCIYILSRS